MEGSPIQKVVVKNAIIIISGSVRNNKTPPGRVTHQKVIVKTPSLLITPPLIFERQHLGYEVRGQKSGQKSAVSGLTSEFLDSSATSSRSMDDIPSRLTLLTDSLQLSR
jgi:hypothetical protein